MENFAAHVKLLHTDGDYRFNQEFEVKWMVFVLSIGFFFSILHKLAFPTFNELAISEETHGQKATK